MLALSVAGVARADPPSRVARLAYASGPASFLPAGDTEWVQANINRPLWNGDRLWVAAGARAEMQIGNATLRLASGTSFSVVNFDDRIAQFEVTQGAVHVHARELASGDTIEVDTPNLAFTINQPGDYRVDVAADAEATSVAVNRGQAEVFGTQNAFVISVGTRYRFQGTDLAVYQPEPVARRDALDVWAAERLHLEERSTSARYVSPEVIGYADLDTSGDWREVPNYGTVWIPSRVAPDWAPYRYGHWAWFYPWGWTWVDDAPWGFAPFHYGRWAFVESRWCWCRGRARTAPSTRPRSWRSSAEAISGCRSPRGRRLPWRGSRWRQAKSTDPHTPRAANISRAST